MAYSRGDSLVLVLFLLALSSTALARTQWHSYGRTCPNVEWIIKDTLNNHLKQDRTIAAGVLRLHFHDCFVNGCDGSILLESTPTDGTDVEREARPNNGSARGFEVINDAKRRLEAACPGVVSCADTLAIAARDSSVVLGGAFYNVQTGRYDGRVSSRQLANQFLPAPNFTAPDLIKNFGRQGLSERDLVVLSGGHTIGTSKCRIFEDRLYNFKETGKPDPTINPAYLSQLQRMCPQGSDSVVELDKGSQFRFDNSYYKNLVNRNGVLTSDQVLAEDRATSGLVRSLAYNPHQFSSEFARSMIKMGSIGWKTKSNGEIRKVCTMVNPSFSSSR